MNATKPEDYNNEGLDYIAKKITNILNQKKLDAKNFLYFLTESKNDRK